MTVKPLKIRIGTRGSDLALTQTRLVEAGLRSHHPEIEIEVVVIKTSGDWVPADGETPLSAADGGKGQFAKEIEHAMLADDIDIAVHSMKDMDSRVTDGLVIDHMLPREDPRDALLLHDRALEVKGLADLPRTMTIGTASVRRTAVLKARCSDLKIVPLRGNVPTRIEKLRAGQVDATLLAVAGLNRLGLADEIDHVIDMEDMLPAAGQGAVGIQMREGEAQIAALLSPISCTRTLLCVQAERGALAALDGSCHTPIGAHAVMEGSEIKLRAEVLSHDGSQCFADHVSFTASDPQRSYDQGHRLGQSLKPSIPEGVL